jgi:putative ABC transport system substrate-binding protein
MALIGGVVAGWHVGVRAQPTDKLRRVGVLMGRAPADSSAQRYIAAFQAGLEKLGWGDGRNLQVDYRWYAGDPNLARSLAKELVASKPEVILSPTTASAAALLEESRTLPIVFVAVSDPVGQGLVTSLARPGGNITGFSAFEPAMASKWLELLKGISPGVARVVTIYNPATSPFRLFLGSLEAAAPSIAVTVIASPVNDRAEVEQAIGAAGDTPATGLLVLSDTFALVHRAFIAELAAHHRIPAIYPFREFAESGGLISYGVDVVDLYLRAASYVDRILRGANPAELPIQAPTKFELVLNLGTARALGIEIPPAILARADEVIE